MYIYFPERFYHSNSSVFHSKNTIISTSRSAGAALSSSSSFDLRGRQSPIKEEETNCFLYVQILPGGQQAKSKSKVLDKKKKDGIQAKKDQPTSEGIWLSKKKFLKGERRRRRRSKLHHPQPPLFFSCLTINQISPNDCTIIPL